DKHREHTYTIDVNGKPETQLIGANGFPSWDAKKSAKENAARLPLQEVWEEWFQSRPKGLRDSDGMELYRAEQWLDSAYEWSIRQWKEYARGGPAYKAAYDRFTAGQEVVKAKYRGPVSELLAWLRRLHPEPNLFKWRLDSMEAAWALVPKKEFDRDPEEKNFH